MIQFANREQLVVAYLLLNPALHRQCVEAKYVPHLYRGGFVIPGFGYSVERIGKWIPADRAGDPELVEKQ